MSAPRRPVAGNVDPFVEPRKAKNGLVEPRMDPSFRGLRWQAGIDFPLILQGSSRSTPVFRGSRMGVVLGLRNRCPVDPWRCWAGVRRTAPQDRCGGFGRRLRYCPQRRLVTMAAGGAGQSQTAPRVSPFPGPACPPKNPQPLNDPGAGIGVPLAVTDRFPGTRRRGSPA